MSWKDEYQLLDMEPEAVMGCTCKKCGSYRAYKVQELLNRFDRQDYPSKIEADLKCYQRGCGGPVRIELSHSHLLTSWVGGMP